MIEEYGVVFPKGTFDDISIYFNHEKTAEEAEKNWNRRRERINYDNIFVLAVEFRESSYEILKGLNDLPYSTVIFTVREYPSLRNTVYVPGYEKQGYIGYLGEKLISGKRVDEQYFDFAAWINRDAFNLKNNANRWSHLDNNK